MYSYQDENKLIYAGASGYHLLQPKDPFIANNEVLTNIPRRYNFNAGFNISGSDVNWAGSLLVMRQENITEVLAGGMIGFSFSDEGMLYAGTWYRVGEAIIPTVNLQWKTMNVGMSYDTSLGGNKSVVRPKSFELSLAARLSKYHDYKTGCFSF